MQHKLILTTAVAVFGLAVLATARGAEPEDLIKYRKSVMSAQGGHMSAIVAIMRGKVDQHDDLQTHAEALALTATLVGGIFPPDSASGDTDAKQAIWDKPDQFAEAVQRLETAAPAFRDAVANDGDTGEALKELGGACKNCHDNFRVKK